MYGSARSPPPLQHPRPQHPPSHLPSTSPPPPDQHQFHQQQPFNSQQYSYVGAGEGAYQRFSSPPVHQQSAYASYMDSAPPPDAYSAFRGSSAGSASAQAQTGPSSSSSRASGPSVRHQQQHQQQPRQPLQRQQPPPSHAQPANGAGEMPAWADPGQGWNFNDPTTAMGVQIGKQAFDAGQKYIDRNVTRLLPLSHLKHSFNVSNGYVLRKIRLVLWPWRHKQWNRQVNQSQQPNGGQAVSNTYAPPREDVNCPDMYIPVMALVTYILLSAVIAGSQGQFNPAILGRTASKSIGLLCLEMLTVKLGCYLLGIGEEGTIVDLLAYEGYKFVGVIVTLVSGLLGASGWSYFAVFLYTFFADFFFLLRSLRHLVLPPPSPSPLDRHSGAAAVPGMGPSISGGQRSRRIQFLFFIALAQGLSMGLLVRV